MKRTFKWKVRYLRLYSPPDMTPRFHVLIVDDDVEIRDYLALALSGPDCRVRAVESPDEVAADDRYDVALVDLLLADGTTADPLIAHLSAAGVRVIVMTGLSADAGPVRRVRRAGAHALLQKPFTLSAVRHEVFGD